MTPEARLKKDVEEIVNGVINSFPFPIKDMLKKYGNRLTNSIVEVSSRYVNAVCLRQQMEVISKNTGNKQ